MRATLLATYQSSQANRPLAAAFSASNSGCRYPSAPRPQLVSLDVGEGSALHEGLLMDGLRDTRTVLEADFGVEIADINYFAACTDRRPEHRVFICPR